VTVASFGPVRQVMTEEWLTSEALVVPVDFATYLAADVARNAALFLVDDDPQFRYYRELGEFEGYPDPAETLGQAIQRGPRATRVRRTRRVDRAGLALPDVVSVMRSSVRDRGRTGPAPAALSEANR